MPVVSQRVWGTGMIRERLTALLRWKTVEVACWAAAAGLGAVYLYDRYVGGRGSEELNISCFAYRDVNRNGIYDVGDRPYAGLQVMLDRPLGGPVTVTSNLSGFANFAMSRGGRAPITRPGRYTITVTPPGHWTITSGNREQTVSFRQLDAAPVGLVAEKTFVPVGVAPELRIDGSVATDTSATEPAIGTVRVVDPEGAVVAMPLSASGRFSIPARAGEWQISRTTRGGATASRTILVKDYAVVLSRLGAGALPPPAKPVRRMADFDALTTSDALFEIPRGYAGLNWTNWVSTHQTLYDSIGMLNGVVSSEYLAYNSSGHPASISSDRAFDFEGVYIGVAWPDAEKHEILIKAWRNDRLAYEDRITGLTTGPIYFDADYRHVTRVEFASGAYWQIVIDDLVFRTDE